MRIPSLVFQNLSHLSWLKHIFLGTTLLYCVLQSSKHIECSNSTLPLRFKKTYTAKRSSQVVLMVKNLPANAGDIRDMGSTPRSGRSPGGGHSNPLQYFCQENPMNREPGGLQSIVLQRTGHDWTDQVCMHTWILQRDPRSSQCCSEELRDKMSTCQSPLWLSSCTIF